MHSDLCLPCYWEYDIDFVRFVEEARRDQGSTFWQITSDNLLESITSLYKGERSFNTLLDRSQGDDSFLPINNWAKEYNKKRINPPELSKWSEDKAGYTTKLCNIKSIQVINIIQITKKIINIINA